MAESAPLTPEEGETWRDFIQMYHRLERHLARHLQIEFGVSGADFEVLVHLTGASRGRLSLSELACLSHWERSRLSHQLNRMQQRGLVRRGAPVGRGSDVIVTAVGRSLMRRAVPDNRDRVREFFVDALGPEDLASMASHTAKITAALDQHVAANCTLDDA